LATGLAVYGALLPITAFELDFILLIVYLLD